MSENTQRINQIIQSSVNSYNESAAPERKITTADNTILFGPGSVLDSLGFVNFIVAIENEIETETSETIFLVDERSMGMEENPFQTISTLKGYIQVRLEELGAI
jgi:acyl carrier protein